VRRILHRSPNFLRKSRRWVKRHPHTVADLDATLIALEDDAFRPALQTHKLSGRWADCYACSAGYDLRIVFELIVRNGAEAINLITLGTHDQLY